MHPFSDAKIIDCWHKNARPWTNAVRTGRIESRRLVTDRALVDAIVSRGPRSVLDVGCGEGWLARELASRDIHVEGIDVVPELVAAAQRGGGGNFRVASYEDLATGTCKLCIDAMVCNFSLLGKESVEGLYTAIPSLLQPQGSVIVQTLHPVSACGDLPYKDGWRQGLWDGCGPDFTDPAPWYFRTLESWQRLFADNGLRLLEMREPQHPKTRIPASIIFIAAKSA